MTQIRWNPVDWSLMSETQTKKFKCPSLVKGKSGTHPLLIDIDAYWVKNVYLHSIFAHCIS